MLIRAIHNALIAAGIENTEYLETSLAPYIGVWPVGLAHGPNTSFLMIVELGFDESGMRHVNDHIDVRDYTARWADDNVAGMSAASIRSISSADPDLIPGIIRQIRDAQAIVDYWQNGCRACLPSE